MITEYIVRLMNYFVLLPVESKYLKADFLYLNFAELAFSYLFIIFFFFSFKNRHYKSFICSFLFLVFFVLSTIYNGILKNSKNIFTLYNIKGKTVVSLINKGNALVLADTILTPKDKIFKYAIYNHLAAERINNVAFKNIRNESLCEIYSCSYGQIFVWQGLKFLRINKKKGEELNIDFFNAFDFLIVSDDDFYKKIMQLEINFKPIILIDSSVKRRKTNTNKNFYDVREQGAFLYDQSF